jgi:hypothetical protein
MNQLRLLFLKVLQIRMIRIRIRWSQVRIRNRILLSSNKNVPDQDPYRMFLGLPEDPLVRGRDPRIWICGSGSVPNRHGWVGELLSRLLRNFLLLPVFNKALSVAPSGPPETRILRGYAHCTVRLASGFKQMLCTVATCYWFLTLLWFYKTRSILSGGWGAGGLFIVYSAPAAVRQPRARFQPAGRGSYPAQDDAQQEKFNPRMNIV